MPSGHDFKGAGGRLCQFQLCAGENKNLFSPDLKVPSELLSVTVLGRDFQVARAEQRKARLTKAVLANGSDSRVVAAEHRVRTLSRNLLWQHRYAGVDVVRTWYVSTANMYVIRC